MHAPSGGKHQTARREVDRVSSGGERLVVAGELEAEVGQIRPQIAAAFLTRRQVSQWDLDGAQSVVHAEARLASVSWPRSGRGGRVLVTSRRANTDLRSVLFPIRDTTCTGNLCGWKEVGVMATTPQADLERAEKHAGEAERLLKGRLGFIWSHVKAQVHATLALYYVEHSDHGR